MNTADLPRRWQADVELLLDAYLLRLGVTSSALRLHWIGQVVDRLLEAASEIADVDIREEAVDRMWDLISLRLAALRDVDPELAGGEVARCLAVLQLETNRDLKNAIFTAYDGVTEQILKAQLAAALAAAAPYPVPVEAALDMPIQSIELRSIPLLSSRSGRAA